MITAVMQPYFFPYIGYYQLIASCDTFVLLDDVNFIQKGWINRNNILLNGQAYLFTIPLDKPSQNKLISETKLKFDTASRQKMLKTLQTAYKKAPQFEHFYLILESIILFEESDDLTDYIENSLIQTFNYLKIEKNFIRSSQLKKDNSLVAQDRILEICHKLDTKLYVNLSGGKALYSTQSFKSKNMDLKFISSDFEKINYKQFKNSFVENLSFIDVIMFNSPNEIKNLLKYYQLQTIES